MQVSPLKNAIHIRFEGKVQDVGFRKTTQRFARQLGLKGWVKNLSDGSVEMVAWGTQADLNRLMARLEGIFSIERQINLPNPKGPEPIDFTIG